MGVPHVRVARGPAAVLVRPELLLDHRGVRPRADGARRPGRGCLARVEDHRRRSGKPSAAVQHRAAGHRGGPPLVRDHRRTGGPVRAGGADRLHGLHPDAGEAGHRGALRRKSIRFRQGGDGPGRRARCGAAALRGGVRRTLPAAVRRAEAAAGGRAGCPSRDPRQPFRADVASSERHRGGDRRRSHPSEDRAEGRHRLRRARLLRRAQNAGARRPRVQLGRRRFRPGCGHRQPVVRRPRAWRPQRRRSPGAVRAPTRSGRRRRDRTMAPDRRRGSRSRDVRRGLARRRGHVPPARAAAGLPRLRERRRGGRRTPVRFAPAHPRRVGRSRSAPRRDPSTRPGRWLADA